MSANIELSSIWKTLATDFESKEFDPRDNDWRRIGTIASSMCVRNPSTNGLWNFKSFLMLALFHSPESDVQLYRAIENRNMGNPYTVNFWGLDIDLTYFRAVQDYKNIKAFFSFPTTSTVLEIGAGFGALAHAILSLEPAIMSYTIVDIPTTLAVSKKYLRAVLSTKNWEKLKFVDALQEFDIQDCFRVDLVINTDSMNEMSKATVDTYLSWINQNAIFFYMNNPIGKYLWNPNGGEVVRSQQVNDALAAGPITDLFELWNSDSYFACHENVKRVYSPGKAWTVVSSGVSVPNLYYYFVYYSKNNR